MIRHGALDIRYSSFDLPLLPFASILLTALLVGCSYYSTSGSLPAHLKTVAVPLFENETMEYGISELATDAVIDQLIQDNVLKVVDQGRADSLLQGRIVRAEDEPFTYTDQEEAREYRFRIVAEISYYDVKRNRTLWEETLEGWGTYDASSEADSDAREAGKADASRMLAKEILDLTTSGW